MTRSPSSSDQIAVSQKSGTSSGASPVSMPSGSNVTSTISPPLATSASTMASIVPSGSRNASENQSVPPAPLSHVLCHCSMPSGVHDASHGSLSPAATCAPPRTRRSPSESNITRSADSSSSKPSAADASNVSAHATVCVAGSKRRITTSSPVTADSLVPTITISPLASHAKSPPAAPSPSTPNQVNTQPGDPSVAYCCNQSSRPCAPNCQPNT